MKTATEAVRRMRAGRATGPRLAVPVALGGALVLGALSAGPLQAQDWRSFNVSRALSGERALDVRVSYGAGQLVLRPGTDEQLYRMDLRYDDDHFDPVAALEGDRLELGIEGGGGSFNLGGDNESRLDLELTRRVPMDLALELGAVRADVDLGGLSLTGLSLETGASQSTVSMSAPNRVRMDRAEFEVGAAEFTASGLGNLNTSRIEVSAGMGDVTLDFTGEWQQDARAVVELGLGALTLRFPEGLGVKLEKDSFLTGLDAQGLIKRGEAWYSPDWESATRRVTVEVDAAFGSIDVRWVR